MEKDITHLLLDSRKEDASLDTYLMESILIGIIFIFSILSALKADLRIVSFMGIALSIIFMGRLSYRNPFCERDDIYVKASDSLLLAGLLQLINYLQLPMYSPMIFSDALFTLTIAGCVVLFWYYIARHPFEFTASCLCDNILVIYKGAAKRLVAQLDCLVY